MKRKIASIAVVAALTLTGTACHDDEETGAAGALTLKQFAASDIASNTRDDREPVEINDLFVDSSNEDPAQYDELLPAT